MNTMWLVEKIVYPESTSSYVGVFVSYKEARKYVDQSPTTEVVEGRLQSPVELRTRQVRFNISPVDVHPEPRVSAEVVDKVLVVAQKFFPGSPVQLKYEEYDMLFITIGVDYRAGPLLDKDIQSNIDIEMDLSDALEAQGLGQLHYITTTGILEEAEK